MKYLYAVPTSAALVALALSLSACNSTGEQPAGPSHSAVTETATAQPTLKSESEATETDHRDEATNKSGDASLVPGGSGTLTIELDGERTEFSPEVVRCHGEPGNIRNVVIKARRDLPLIKVTPRQFAMVKMTNQGAPEKTNATDAITTTDDTVTFDNAEIGGAVVDGEVQCLQGNS